MKAGALASVLALAAIAAPALGLPGWSLSLATTASLTALSLIGLNLIFGVAGMLAFGQAALMALPAYAAGMLVRAGMPLLLAIPAGLAAGLLGAWLVALVFVRLPGIFLAVGTLGLGFVVEGLARAFPDITGGASGLVLQGGALPALAWYAIAIAALALGLVAYTALVRGARGRRLRTICHDELMAAALGIDVVRAKTAAFTAGSAFAVVAGLLLAFYVGVIVPENAGVERSLEQIGTVMLGGPGFLLGPVIGAALVGWLFFAAGWAARFELLIYGAVFLAAVLYAREGIAGWLQAPWQRLRDVRPPPAPRAAPRTASQFTGPPLTGPPLTGPGLVVAGLSKRFGGVQALSDIAFSVDAGEIFTLVGPNGAGKSTLFNLISGLLPPTAGSILVAGQDVAALPVHRRAALIGRSFQVARLVPSLTATENLAVRLDHLAGAPAGETARRAAARAQLDAFGLLHLAERPVRTLSVGQHKLVDLARAALLAPPLVLLDEPAVGLQVDELIHLEDLLRQLQRGGSAVVIVEHNIDFVARVAARGLVLDSGRPIALGPIADILADPAVHEAYFGVLA